MTFFNLFYEKILLKKVIVSFFNVSIYYIDVLSGILYLVVMNRVTIRCYCMS